MPQSQGVVLVVVARGAAALTWTADVATCCMQNLSVAMVASCARQASPESHLVPQIRPHSWSTKTEDVPSVELVEMVAVLQSSVVTFAALQLPFEASSPPEQVMTPGVMVPGLRMLAAFALVVTQLADSAHQLMNPAIAAQSRPPARNVLARQSHHAVTALGWPTETAPAAEHLDLRWPYVAFGKKQMRPPGRPNL